MTVVSHVLSSLTSNGADLGLLIERAAMEEGRSRLLRSMFTLGRSESANTHRKFNVAHLERGF